MRFHLGEVACSTHTIPQLLDELRTLLTNRSLQPRTILTVNAHIYNRAVEDPGLRTHLEAARIVTADGMGIVWAARCFGVRIAERCNMTEALRTFLLEPNMPASRAVVIGCSSDEAEAAAAHINRVSSHCHALKGYSGFLSDAEYREICAAQGKEGVDLIVLGMGTPRTEQVAQIAAASCPGAIVWGAGGGTVRILAGTMREAPVAWRRAGLQWLYRLGCEPRKLAHRYLIGNPLFVWRIWQASRKARQ